MAPGRLLSIHVVRTAGGPPEARASVRTVPGGGLEGGTLKVGDPVEPLPGAP